ncbi:hypothetical protein SCHPADRAFT_947977 [Schizopora paradoxa]|uniref:Uncharacterized protein n=1 Tax=Schizopora paradoxa TaxID=27342 RepID=A0A0H2RGR7_9AGAM|nr:hypothetical protein SCHPADRAFT_947977 [Schizopora paradoxa]
MGRQLRVLVSSEPLSPTLSHLAGVFQPYLPSSSREMAVPAPNLLAMFLNTGGSSTGETSWNAVVHIHTRHRASSPGASDVVTEIFESDFGGAVPSQVTSLSRYSTSKSGGDASMALPGRSRFRSSRKVLGAPQQARGISALPSSLLYTPRCRRDCPPGYAAAAFGRLRLVLPPPFPSPPSRVASPSSERWSVSSGEGGLAHSEP